MTETEALLALNLLPMVGSVRVRKLMERMGSPQSILLARKSTLLSVPGIGPEVAEQIATWETRVDLERELRRIREIGAHLITQSTPEYPENLRNTHSPPLVLYVWGKLLERDRHAIGIVGSRRATHYGRDCAHRFASHLAHAGLTVVSGLAAGIDTFAHEGALKSGRTIAIIGSGLAKLYPAENAKLAERITSSGAVITEFPVDMPPDKQSFPLRNRIVAGWCQGLLVVEAPTKSGSLITASQALEENRNLYSIPGPIDRPTSFGTNRLIQQGAKLVMSPEEILEDYDHLLGTGIEKGMANASSAQRQLALDDMAPKATVNKAAPALAPVPLPVSLSEVEIRILDALGHNELHLDDLSASTDIPPGPLSAQLMRLEIKHLVRQLPGKWFARRS